MHTIDTAIKPGRVQRQRRSGWRKPANTVIVDRTSRWGNPFRPLRRDGEWVVVDDNGVDYQALANTKYAATVRAVELFELDLTIWGTAALTVDQVRTDLAGKHLACWCPLDQPCHADVLLRIANEKGAMA